MRLVLRITTHLLGWLLSVLVWECAETACAQTSGLRLELLNFDSNGWAHVCSVGLSNRVHTLQVSSNLTDWFNLATLHDGPFDFADVAAAKASHGFYRAMSRNKTANDDGKNQIIFPGDPFLSNPTYQLGETRWIKFAILRSDTNRVWFQDSAKYAFHYDYAVKRLAPFAGLSRAQFDAVSLRTNNQQVVLGAVLFGPESFPDEFAIQFVGLDAYPAEQVIAWFGLVQAAVRAPASARVFYIPTLEQSATAESNRSQLERQGILLSRIDRWQRDNACYSHGWALGRLVFVSTAEINAAYADGRLKPTDILLTDGVPAEVPYVAGLVSLSPATPNSHVAILARSYRIPFVYVVEAAEQARLRGLAGNEMLLRVEDRNCEVKAVPTDAGLDPALRAEILALKAPGKIDLTPKAPFGALSTKVDGLNPADRRYFGGKAANFGLLRRTVPTNSPSAIAFSFDLWDGFLDQTLPNSGKTLRQEIRARTAGYTYPPDMASVRATLAAIRDLIRNTARFSAAQQAAILSALSDFEPSRKIRFRSSTNIEDSEQFTGAGLYDSFSGCRADDLDENTTGPSECDPNEANERGVFRAIQRVYASFYNDNAWLERLRFSLNEEELGMAVLAHYSFPDEQELANGVATLTYTEQGDFRNYETELVTQLGAVSVTNPEGDARPEVVSGSQFGDSVYVSTREASNLVPLGGNVMVWEKDYRDLMNLLVRVADAYAKLVPQKPAFTLDFEYKKMQPGVLELKQIREVPRPESGKTLTPFLLNEPTVYCVFQGEQGDVFAIHRLKCRLTLNTRNLRMTETNLTASFYSHAVLEFLDGTNIVQLTSGVSGWPQASYSLSNDIAEDRWSFGSGADMRRFTLETSIIRQVDTASSPLLTQGDFSHLLRMDYARAIPTFDFDGPTNTTSESVLLRPCPVVTPQSLLQFRVMTNKTGLKIETTFYWPEAPRGPSAGYTAPLIQWVETRITGLTQTPLVLYGFYSQTYHPGHHNFWEEFIYEPQLEPGIGAAQQEELRAKNVQMLLVSSAEVETKFTVLGFDGKFRPPP